MDTITPDWTSLPTDLLALIAKCLKSPIEIRRFRAICSSFRFSVPFPPKILALKISISSDHDVVSHYELGESTIYAIEPLNKISNTYRTTKTWLVRVEDSGPNRFAVKDPLNGFPFRNLSPKLPKFLNLLDYRVQEITNVYRVRLVGIDKGGDKARGFYDINPVCFKKVVLSKCFDEIEDEFAFIALTIERHLCLWRHGYEKLTYIDNLDHGFYFEDIVYHNEKFYAIGCSTSAHTITVDPKSLAVNEIVDPQWVTKTSTKYLVKSCDDLYLIEKYYLDHICSQENSDNEHHLMHLHVFKLDEMKRRWVQVMNGLDDRVPFVGNDCSFYLSAKEFKGFKGNCVYFNDKKFSKVTKDYPGSDAGIFDMEDDSIEPLSAFPGHFTIFWPPQHG